MTPEDIKFMQSQASHNRPDIQRLRNLLIETEAMRKKAEHAASPHRESVNAWLGFGGGIECSICAMSDADWIRAVRER